MFTTPSRKKRKQSHKTPSRDRFIPNRAAMDLDVSHYNLSKENSDPTHLDTSPSKEEYKANLAASLFPKGKEPNGKVLAFKQKAPEPNECHQSNLRILYSQFNEKRKMKQQRSKSYRHIPQQPEKVLDAPMMLDDYYLNLVDWNSSNILCVALSSSVYLWNASTGDIQEIKAVEEGYVTSVSWIQQGNYLAIGDDTGCVQLWDASRSKQVRNMRGHEARVSSLSWNKWICSSGSRDTNIVHHDVRQAKNVVKTLSNGHKQEVCGLKWSDDGSQLASGGNDNVLNIWDGMNDTASFKRTDHTAAVKAIAWCPWQPRLLATGGGTADRKLRFWNTQTGACLNCIDTHSQVCSIQWSKHQRELVSSHGFSQNQLIVWKYPSMVKLAELKGHTSRVLHMAQSPDGCTVVSAAGDETLRFWKVFDINSKNKNHKSNQTFRTSLIR